LALESLDVVLKFADVGVGLVDRFRSLALSGVGAAPSASSTRLSRLARGNAMTVLRTPLAPQELT